MDKTPSSNPFPDPLQLLAEINQTVSRLCAEVQAAQHEIAQLRDAMPDSGRQQGDAVWTTDAAAQYIGRTPGWLEKQRVTGGGPSFIKMGRLVRYRKSALDAWLDQQSRRSTAEGGHD